MELEKRTILIVDDEQALRSGVATVMKAAGFQTVEAENGNEALQKVWEYHPVMIILDVMFP